MLSQLGNRVEHALRAFTPDDETALRATVRTFLRSAGTVLGREITRTIFGARSR